MQRLHACSPDPLCGMRQGLPRSDVIGSSDPYVKCVVYPVTDGGGEELHLKWVPSLLSVTPPALLPLLLSLAPARGSCWPFASLGIPTSLFHLVIFSPLYS